jgi:hypothetical protein
MGPGVTAGVTLPDTRRHAPTVAERFRRSETYEPTPGRNGPTPETPACGRCGIRTHGGLATTTVFEFDRNGNRSNSLTRESAGQRPFRVNSDNQPVAVSDRVLPLPVVQEWYGSTSGTRPRRATRPPTVAPIPCGPPLRASPPRRCGSPQTVRVSRSRSGPAMSPASRCGQGPRWRAARGDGSALIGGPVVER